MKKFLLALTGLVPLAFSSLAAAQTTVALPQVVNAGGAKVPSQASVLIDPSGAEKGTLINPLQTAANTDGVRDGIAATGSASSAANIVSVPMVGYSGGAIQITSIGTGNTVTFEQSNDNSNWQPLLAQAATYASSNASTSAASTGLWNFASNASYVRARVSSYGSGTVAATIVQKRVAPPVSGFSIAGGSSTLGFLLNYSGYTDSMTALGASATFTGTGRAFTSAVFSYFTARAYGDAAGTLYIDQSLDAGTSYQVVASQAVSAGTMQTLTVRVVGGASSSLLYRVRYVNGTTAQTVLRLSSAFSTD